MGDNIPEMRKIAGFTILFSPTGKKSREGFKNDHPWLIFLRMKSDLAKWKEKIKSQMRTCF